MSEDKVAAIEADAEREVADASAFGEAGTPPDAGSAQPLMFAKGDR